MYKKKFKPLWSINIINTENWLKEMAINGYKLVKVNFYISQFIFEKSESNKINYTICRHKPNTNILSKTLDSAGWNSVFSKGYWYILANKNSINNIKVSPTRKEIFNRNTLIKNFLISLMLIYSTLNILFFITFTKSLFKTQLSNLFFDPFYLLTFAILTIMYGLPIYFIVKINRDEKKMNNESFITPDLNLSDNFLLNSKTKSQLKKQGKLIKKFNLTFYCAPDKIVQWLESMEKQGYNLCKIGKLGKTFYFIKNKPRNIKYFFDYQTNPNDYYFEIHKENGWHMIYKSLFKNNRYTLWAKEYSNIVPNFYSNSKDILNQARNVCLLYLSMSGSIILWAILMITLLDFSFNIFIINDPFIFIFSLLFLITILESIIYIPMTVSYYIRTKKSVTALNDF